MPRRCSVCENNARKQIDEALLAGGSLRDIARQFGLTKDALARHKSGAHIAKPQEGRRANGNSDLSVTTACDKPEQLRRVLARVEEFMEACAGKSDFRGALQGARVLFEILRGSPEPKGDEAAAPKLIIVHHGHNHSMTEPCPECEAEESSELSTEHGDTTVN